MARKVNAQYGVFFVLLVFVMPAVTPIPLSIADRITLQVQPEYLMNHRLVLSLEPLEETREAKSLQVDTPTSSTTPSGEEDPTSTTPTTTTNSTTTTTSTSPSPDNTTVSTTTTAPEVTTQEENAQDSIAPFIPSAPSRPIGEGDVDELLITIPHRCPPDYLVDPSGKCRPVFRRAAVDFNRARSFSDGLFSPPSSRHFAFLSAPSVPSISLPVSPHEFIPVSPATSMSSSFLASVNQGRPSRLTVKKGVDHFNKVN